MHRRWRPSPTASPPKSRPSWVQNRLMRRFILFLLTATILSAQSGKPKAPGEDWVSLFNGKDLSGWIKIGDETWTAENGTIHGVAATKGYGYLRTEKNFKDFHL